MKPGQGSGLTADFLFEQPDLAAERRLRQAQARRGPAEVQLPRATTTNALMRHLSQEVAA